MAAAEDASLSNSSASGSSSNSAASADGCGCGSTGGSSDDVEQSSAERRCLRHKTTIEVLVDALHGEDSKEFRTTRVLCKVLAGPAVALVVAFLHFGIFRFGDAFDGRNWWKCMVACLLIWVPLTALTMSVNLAQWVYQGLSLGRVVPSTAAIGGVVFVSVWLPVSFLGKDFGYRPAPFVGYLAATAAAWAMACYGWFAIPADLRRQTDVRLRLKGAALFNSQLLQLVLAYDLVLAMCRALWQPLTVFAFSALHALLNQALRRLLYMVDGSGAKAFIAFYLVHTLHIVFLTTYVLGSKSWLVAAIATAVDLLMNFKYLLVIATGWPLRKLLLKRLAPPCVARALAWEEAESECQKDLVRVRAGSHMVVTETNEMLQPLLYFAVIYFIYHGRNADALAGVGATKFGENALHGTEQLWGRIAVMMALDTFTCIITAIVMRASHINLFDFYLAEVERHWVPIALLQVWVLDTVLCEEAVGCFVDFSFEFAWMH